MKTYKTISISLVPYWVGWLPSTPTAMWPAFSMSRQVPLMACYDHLKSLYSTMFWCCPWLSVDTTWIICAFHLQFNFKFPQLQNRWIASPLPLDVCGSVWHKLRRIVLQLPSRTKVQKQLEAIESGSSEELLGLMTRDNCEMSPAFIMWELIQFPFPQSPSFKNIPSAYLCIPWLCCLLPPAIGPISQYVKYENWFWFLIFFFHCGAPCREYLK